MPPARGRRNRGFLGFPVGSHRHAATRRANENCAFARENGAAISQITMVNLASTACLFQNRVVANQGTECAELVREITSVSNNVVTAHRGVPRRVMPATVKSQVSQAHATQPAGKTASEYGAGGQAQRAQSAGRVR